MDPLGGAARLWQEGLAKLGIAWDFLLYAFPTILIILAACMILINGLLWLLSRKSPQARLEAAIDARMQARQFRKAWQLAEDSGRDILIAGVRTQLREEKQKLISRLYKESWESLREYEQFVRDLATCLELLGSPPDEWDMLVSSALRTGHWKVRKFLAERVPSPTWRRELLTKNRGEKKP